MNRNSANPINDESTVGSMSNDTAPKSSAGNKKDREEGHVVLKCLISEQTRHALEIFRVTRKQKLGEAVQFLLGNALNPRSSEEHLIEILQSVAPELYASLDRSRRAQNSPPWYTFLRQLLAYFVNHSSELATAVQRPLPSGSSSPLAPPRPSSKPDTTMAGTPNRIRSGWLPGVGVIDATDADAEQSGTRIVSPNR
jgi:hypothetical protein